MVLLSKLRKSLKEPLLSLPKISLLKFTTSSPNAPRSSRSKKEPTNPPKPSTGASLNSSSSLLTPTLSKLFCTSPSCARKRYLSNHPEHPIRLRGLEKSPGHSLRNNQKRHHSLHPQEQSLQNQRHHKGSNRSVRAPFRFRLIQ